MVRLTDRPDMTLDVYRGRKTTIQQQQQYMYVKYMYVNLLAGQTNFLFVNHLQVLQVLSCAQICLICFNADESKNVIF